MSTVHSYVSLLALGEIKKNTQDNDGQSGIAEIMMVNQEYAEIMIDNQEYAR